MRQLFHCGLAARRAEGLGPSEFAVSGQGGYASALLIRGIASQIFEGDQQGKAKPFRT